MPKFLVILLIQFALQINSGNAVLQCRNPPQSAQLYLNLAELQTMSTNHPDTVQQPLECSQDDYTFPCLNQLCCDDEVGCCYHDAFLDKYSCGCKSPTDSECTRSAPLAVIQNYGCDSDELGEISICLRKDRDGETDDTIIETYIGQDNKRDAETGSLNLTVPILETGTRVIGRSIILELQNKRRDVLSKFTSDELSKLLDTKVLDKLADHVIYNRRQGLPYGWQN